MSESERLRTDQDYFEEKRLELADELMAASEGPMNFFEALDLAQDRLMDAAGF